MFGPPPLTWPGAYLAAHDDVQEELEDAESSDDEPESTNANAKAVVQSDQDTDSDVEPELSVDVSVKYPTLHFQNFVRPHATGAKAPPYQLLGDLPPEQGRDRLIFIDFIHPRYPKLKGGITIFMLLMDFFFWKAILRIEPPKRHSTPLRAAGSYPVKVSTLARTRAVALFRRYNRD